MAEQRKSGKVSLRQILNEIAEDEIFSERERERALIESYESEYKEWKKAQVPDILR